MTSAGRQSHKLSPGAAGGGGIKMLRLMVVKRLLSSLFPQ